MWTETGLEQLEEFCKSCDERLIGYSRLRLKCDGTRAETRFRPSAKRTSPFKWTGASVQSTTGSRGVRINGSNAGYTMFRDSVKSTGYPLHSPVSPSLSLPCVTVCHHISAGLYTFVWELSAPYGLSRAHRRTTERPVGPGGHADILFSPVFFLIFNLNCVGNMRHNL
jgi:hypothetical protein